MQDLQFALRTLRKQPLFALVAVLTLALGIGANTAIFTLVYQTLLQPLPVANADRLVFVWNTLRRHESGAGERVDSGLSRSQDAGGGRRGRHAVHEPHGQHQRRRQPRTDSRACGHAVVLFDARRAAGSRPRIHRAGSDAGRGQVRHPVARSLDRRTLPRTRRWSAATSASTASPIESSASCRRTSICSAATSACSCRSRSRRRRCPTTNAATSSAR